MTSKVMTIQAHHLDHPTKPLYYVYRVYPGRVSVERWEAGVCNHATNSNTQAARRHYVHMLKLGYEPF